MAILSDVVIPLLWLFLAYYGFRFGVMWQTQVGSKRSNIITQMVINTLNQSAYHKTTAILAPIISRYVHWLFIEERTDIEKVAWATTFQIVVRFVITIVVFGVLIWIRNVEISGELVGRTLFQITALLTTAAILGGVFITAVHEVFQKIDDNFSSRPNRSFSNYILFPLVVLLFPGGLFFLSIDFTLSNPSHLLFVSTIMVFILIAFMEFINDWMLFREPTW